MDIHATSIQESEQCRSTGNNCARHLDGSNGHLTLQTLQLSSVPRKTFARAEYLMKEEKVHQRTSL